MGVMPDWMIRKLSLDPETRLISPFSERVDGSRIASFGLEPAGYTARLNPNIRVVDWAKAAGTVLDPLDPADNLYSDQSADPSFILPPNSMMVCWTIERFRIPRNCIVRGAGKTVYSSAGINFDVASIHPGWEGHLKLHVSNSSTVPVRVYGGMGIVYVDFHEIDGEVERDYSQLKAPRFQGHGPNS